MDAVVRVVPKANFSLELWFNTGDHRLFDVRPYLDKVDFSRLKDEALFRQAHVALYTVCWPGGLDIAPDSFLDRSSPVNEAQPMCLTDGHQVSSQKCLYRLYSFNSLLSTLKALP